MCVSIESALSPVCAEPPKDARRLFTDCPMNSTVTKPRSSLGGETDLTKPPSPLGGVTRPLLSKTYNKDKLVIHQLEFHTGDTIDSTQDSEVDPSIGSHGNIGTHANHGLTYVKGTQDNDEVFLDDKVKLNNHINNRTVTKSRPTVMPTSEYNKQKNNRSRQLFSPGCDDASPNLLSQDETHSSDNDSHHNKFSSSDAPDGESGHGNPKKAYSSGIITDAEDGDKSSKRSPLGVLSNNVVNKAKVKPETEKPQTIDGHVFVFTANTGNQSAENTETDEDKENQKIITKSEPRKQKQRWMEAFSMEHDEQTQNPLQVCTVLIVL